MRAAEFIRSIRKVWEYTEHIGVGELFSGPNTLTASDNFRAISRDSNVTYEELYLCGLKYRDYNILLKDYAYFQFSFSCEDEFRFAYYPNPFLGASPDVIVELSERREYVDEGIIEVEEYLHGIAELRFSQHPPLVRYENDPINYSELRHPCSHFHIGHHSENRWPVQRVLNPAAFSLLLLKLFYFEYWEKSELFPLNGNEFTLDDLLSRKRAECRILPDKFFTPAEKLHFSFF